MTHRASPPDRRLQLEVDVLRRAGVRFAHAPIPSSRPSPAPERAVQPAVHPVAAPAAHSAIPAPSVAARQRELDALHLRIRDCSACKLCETRTLAVPGEGTIDPPILFIGEGPGAEEDRSGRPFVGPAGQLLTKMIGAIGLDRSEVFIANIVKCRPPANRIPEPDEVRACSNYLDRQIELLRPRTICTLGAPSTKALVPSVNGITAARGRQFDLRGIPLIPTFHPAYLLRQPSGKRAAWEDLKKIARLALGREL